MDEKWHLSKSVSLGHIVTTLSMFAGAFFYLASTDNRISLIEQDQVYLRSTVSRVERQQKEIDDKLSKRIDTMENRIREDLKDLNSTIVNFIENSRKE